MIDGGINKFVTFIGIVVTNAIVLVLLNLSFVFKSLCILLILILLLIVFILTILRFLNFESLSLLGMAIGCGLGDLVGIDIGLACSGFLGRTWASRRGTGTITADTKPFLDLGKPSLSTVRTSIV